MEIKATLEELKQALAVINQKYEDNIEFNRLEAINGKKYQVTLKVKDASRLGKGRKLGYQYISTGKGVSSNGSACWHVHGDFFEALFAINPSITIRSLGKLITKDAGNWEDRDIGSLSNPIYASQCCNCGEKTLLDELKECGYEITEKGKTNVTLNKNQYLDDGYGYYFDAEVELTYNIRKDEVTRIKVDNYTEKQIEKLLQKEIAKCAYMKKYDECFESMLYGCESCTHYKSEKCELDKKEENCYEYETVDLNQDCNDCKYLSMIESLYQCLNDGPRW